MKLKHLYLFLAIGLLAGGCTPDRSKQTEWLERTNRFQDRYELEQLMVLSRHNIRTPMVGKGSVLTRVTDSTHVWFAWEEPTSYLTNKGQRLEDHMGVFFREWLTKKGLTARYASDTASFRFYANAKQRCQLTARTFADAVLPGKSPTVEMHVEFDKMDPVFNPQITKLPAGFAEKAQQEIAARMGDLDAGIFTQYADLWLIYASADQLRSESSLSYGQPPVAVRLQLDGLTENADRLYCLQDVEQRFNEAIEAYETL